MTHVEMDAIEIEDPPVRLQRALPPGFELLLEILVEAADRAGARGHTQQGLGDFSDGCRVLAPATNISVSPWATWGS